MLTGLRIILHCDTSEFSQARPAQRTLIFVVDASLFDVLSAMEGSVGQIFRGT
jgi:hypothetical protein